MISNQDDATSLTSSTFSQLDQISPPIVKLASLAKITLGEIKDVLTNGNLPNYKVSAVASLCFGLQYLLTFSETSNYANSLALASMLTSAIIAGNQYRSACSFPSFNKFTSFFSNAKVEEGPAVEMETNLKKQM